jgi:hypothetical protein
MPMVAYSWARYCDSTLVENRQSEFSPSLRSPRTLNTLASKRLAAQRLQTSSTSRSPSARTNLLEESDRESPVSHFSTRPVMERPVLLV